MAAPEGYKTLGKIGISYKGDYNINTAYERLDAVLHNGSTYLALVDAPDGAPRDDKINWIYLAKGFSSDIGDSEITFTEAEARENIDTGESVKTVFGKIKKFFTDLTAPAFAQMITSKDDLLATKATGYVPDAKAVADAVTDVTGKLGNFYLLYSHLCGTAGNSIWRQNPQFPEEYYAQYTVPEKEGYRFFFSFWQISWTNNNEYCNYLIRNPFLHEKNGNIEVYSKDGTPTFVPVFLCIYLPV